MAPSVHQVISSVLRKVIPEMHQTAINMIVTHLTSDSVGVTNIDDLKVVDRAMLPVHEKLTPIKIIKLLDQFKNYEADLALPEPTQQPSTSQQNNCMSISRQDIGRYLFTVPWSTLPQKTLQGLADAKKAKKRANPKLIDDLRQAIVPKLVEDYETYKEVHPEAQKHPGRVVYRAICGQIVSRYEGAVKETVRGVAVSDKEDSMPNFLKELENSVQNCKRNRKNQKRTVGKKKGVIGVDSEMYKPEMTPGEVREQESMRQEMQDDFLSGEKDWAGVKEAMNETYSLQRKYIIEARNKIEEQAKEMAKEKDNKENDDDDVDTPPTPSALADLKRNWPFLFTAKGIMLHQATLGPKDLMASYEKFRAEDENIILHFFTSCSKSNVKNLAARISAENNSDSFESLKLLLLVRMMAHHFDEDIEDLIIPVEKTSDPALFQYTVLEKVSHACIVALDTNEFMAKRYIVCIDRQAMIETEDANEAVVALVSICFALDVEYPPLPLVFELVERFVFTMKMTEGKIRKRGGSQITVLTEKVKRVIDEYELFKDEFLNLLNPRGIVLT